MAQKADEVGKEDEEKEGWEVIEAVAFERGEASFWWGGKRWRTIAFLGIYLKQVLERRRGFSIS